MVRVSRLINVDGTLLDSFNVRFSAPGHEAALLSSRVNSWDELFRILTQTLLLDPRDAELVILKVRSRGFASLEEVPLSTGLAEERHAYLLD